MKILFIGGTGVISSACSELAVASGFDLYLLNRGQSALRPTPPTAQILCADIRDKKAAEKALEGHIFDVVVNWVAYTPEHIETDLELFRGKIGQYVFISSASAYQTPPSSLPVTESTLLDNPFWDYSRAKIACEERLLQAYRDEKFPVTIVRPSHTYDPTKLPVHGGYTAIARMMQGKPVIVHGDGTSLWTLTHHIDFAPGFVGLLANHQAIGQAYHITTNEVLTWNQIFALLAQAAGVEAKLIHIPSEFIAAFDAEWGAGLLGDKAHSMIFDNSKIKRLAPNFAPGIPFSRGAKEIINWYNADPARQVVDESLDRRMDEIIAAYKSAWPR
ncbi:MAG TPA: SDR family oxidoreductase [Chloroflexi bacterium]|nr:SDR family oxidoreductase [Chloroflexota bacterium]